MSNQPHDAELRVTTAGWCDLADEFERWGEAGRVATLWWRDDDATAASDRLDRLLAIAGDVPVALAVIPAAADAGLAARLAHGARSGETPPVAVLQHGWRHLNHAADHRKSEFPPGRPRAAVSADLAAGRARLTAFFGTAALPVLAPPWNRFDPDFLPLLTEYGIGAISRANPRRAAWPMPGVFEADVHVDLVAWGGDRGFIGDAAALGGLVGHLRGRRLGRFDGDEPTGILTHHLVQDEAADSFLARLVAVTGAHPAVRWLGAGEVFAPGLGGRV